MRTVADRLNEAIKSWHKRDLTISHGSIRKLQLRLRARGAEGSSYGNVRSLVKNPRSRASEAFIKAAAEVLQVRPEWLSIESGAMTPAEQDQLAVAGASHDVDLPKREGHVTVDAVTYVRKKDPISPEETRAIIVEEIPALRDAVAALAYTWSYLDGLVLSMLAWPHRFGHGGSGGSQDTAPMRCDVVRTAARMVAAPAAAAGIDPSQLSPWQLARYIQLQTAACEMLFVSPGDIGPMIESSPTV